MTAPNTPAETSDQLNKPAKSGKLEVSDLITIGVFAALYFVMVCIATLVSTLFTGGFGSIFLPPSRPSSPAACTCCWPHASANSAASPSWA